MSRLHISRFFFFFFIFFYFLAENKAWHYIHVVSNGDNMNDIANLTFC